ALAATLTRIGLAPVTPVRVAAARSNAATMARTQIAMAAGQSKSARARLASSGVRPDHLSQCLSLRRRRSEALIGRPTAGADDRVLEKAIWNGPSTSRILCVRGSHRRDHCRAESHCFYLR